MSCFVDSLRGGGFMIYASGLRCHINKVKEVTLSHVVILWLGGIKGYHGGRHHPQTIVNKT